MASGGLKPPLSPISSPSVRQAGQTPKEGSVMVSAPDLNFLPQAGQR